MIYDLQKRPPFRSEPYLSWVRSLPCCGCGVVGRVEAHHNIADRFGTAKAPDAYALPLCPDCHRELHRNWHEWEAIHGPQWRHACRTLHEALRAGVLTIDNKTARGLAA